jgi:hypothetical protein
MTRRWTTFFAAVVLVVATAVVGAAQQLSIDEQRVYAEQGDILAQHRLGAMYASGQGVPQDDAEAVRWFRLAADQGFFLAQGNLGFFYSEGRGVVQDYAEAVRWWRLAADQGDAVAQNNLGNAYYRGHGVPQDDAEAVRWYRLAADQGAAVAQGNLGVMYSDGRGVPQDFIRAYMWANLAASNLTGTEREEIVNARDGLFDRLTPAQRAEGRRLALEWTARVTVPSISPRIEDVPPSGSEGGKGGTEQQIDIAEILRSQEFRGAVARVVSEHCHYTGIVAPGPVNCFDTPIGTRRSSPSSSYAELLGSQEFRRAVARVVGNGGCNYMGIVNFVRGPIPPGPINCVGIGRSISLRRSGSALLRSQEFGPAVERVVNNNCNYIGGYMFDGFIPPGPIDCGVPR